MIRKASFRNFKSLRDVDVEFERFTVIVGPNASGKTSILQGLDYISKVCSRKRGDHFATDEELSALRCKANDETSFSVKVATEEIEVEWTQHIGPPPIFIETSGRFRELREGGQDWTSLEDVQARHGRYFPDFKATVQLKFEAGGLAAPSYSSELPPRIDPDGAGLSSALAYIALNRPEIFNELQTNIRSIIPTLRRIRFDRVPLFMTQTETVKIDSDELTRQVRKQYIGDTLIFDFDGAPGIPASGVSEGTLVVLGLLAVVMSPNRPRLVLLDDLERGLHPTAQRELVKLIRKLLAQYPDLQIIATSHSPYLLDDLEPREVLLTWADEDGITSCARIDEHPEFERWKDEMSPGTFWSVMGEKWVKDVTLQNVS
jgi:predicted ATPase